MTNFVNPPLTDVEDYPPTGSYTLSPEQFSGLDTRLAWSAVEPKPYFNEQPKHGWATTIKVAAAAAAAVLGAIVAAAVMLKLPGHVESTSVTQTVTATTAASPTREADREPPPGPFVMPTVMAAHETQDGDYFQRQLQAGFEIYDHAQNVHFAHVVCNELARGVSYPVLFKLVTLGNPGKSPLYVTTVIRMARDVYCPELG